MVTNVEELIDIESIKGVGDMFYRYTLYERGREQASPPESGERNHKLVQTYS